MQPFDFGSGVIDGGGRAVDMTPLRAAAHLDALQDFRLKGGAVAFECFEPVVAGGLLECFDRGDAEVGVELADPIGPEAGNAQHGEHAFRNLLAHGFQPGVLAGLVDLGDDGGDRIADAGNLGQPAFFIRWSSGSGLRERFSAARA